MILLLQSILIQLDLASKRLRQISSLEYMGRLEEWVLHLTPLVLHDLLNEIPIDLAQAAIEHLASLEHIEDAI